MKRREAEALAERLETLSSFTRPIRIVPRATPDEFVVTAWYCPPDPAPPREVVLWDDDWNVVAP